MSVDSVAPIATDMQHDPSCFAVDYDPGSDCLTLVRVTAERIAQASFLDERTAFPLATAEVLAVADCIANENAPALLFHTAFCGSTLLARALQAPPAVMSLREPGVLLALAMASLRSQNLAPMQIERAAQAILGLLGRPWAEQGRVVIKPTNQVNRILPILLAASPHSQAILLYSSLEQFLLSCLKKLPAAEQRIRWMAQALLPGTQLAQRLGIPLTHRFNLVESAVLTWFAQMEIYALALRADCDDRLRSLELGSLLAEPLRAVTAATWHLSLPAARDGLATRVLATFSRDAKAPDRAFDTAQRTHENELIGQRYRDVIGPALRWAEQAIAPAAIVPSEWKPLLA